MRTPKKIRYYVSKQGCWICTSHSLSNGYPIVSRGGRRFKLSRVMYEKYKGKIPTGMVVRHKCDNPACINPDHLLIGTQLDNIQDRVDRDRSVKGEDVHSATLTEKEVKEIIKLANRPIEELAEKFNTTKNVISKILRGIVWKHLIPGKYKHRDKKQKLTNQQKNIIRNSNSKGKDLAKRFGVTEAYISMIRSNKV